MKFVHSREIDVPVTYLFDRASDFPTFERRGPRSGIEVHRLSGGPVTIGCRWHIAGTLRGKPRVADIQLAELIRPDRIAIAAVSGGFQFDASVNFIALTKRSSRIETTVEARATTLRSRVLLHSLRLVRGRIAKRMRAVINAAARKAEQEFRA